MSCNKASAGVDPFSIREEEEPEDKRPNSVFSPRCESPAGNTVISDTDLHFIPDCNVLLMISYFLPLG